MVTSGEWARQWRDSRPTRRLIVGGALLSALILAATVFVILETRAKEILDAKSMLMTLNLSLAEQTARAIQGVDLVLDSIVDQVKAGAPLPGLYPANAENKARYEAFRAGKGKTAD